jgi:hypothetical protein
VTRAWASSRSGGVKKLRRSMRCILVAGAVKGGYDLALWRWAARQQQVDPSSGDGLQETAEPE